MKAEEIVRRMHAGARKSRKLARANRANSR
jgi:hypothetical protein